MSKRDDVFQTFGPLLTEAIVLVFLQNINVLRKEQGMKIITYDNMLDDLANHHSHLDDYPWMLEPFTVLKQPPLPTPPGTDDLPKPKSFTSSISATLKSLTKLIRR